MAKPRNNVAQVSKLLSPNTNPSNILFLLPKKISTVSKAIDNQINRLKIHSLETQKNALYLMRVTLIDQMTQTTKLDLVEELFTFTK